jgi:anti-anti-sigma regulatory factor
MTDLLNDRGHGVVRLSGDLHLGAIDDLRHALAAVPGDEVLVDLRDVRLLTAAALGVFVGEAKRRPVRLRNASAMHCRVLAATDTEWLIDGSRP